MKEPRLNAAVLAVHPRGHPYIRLDCLHARLMCAGYRLHVKRDDTHCVFPLPSRGRMEKSQRFLSPAPL